MNEDRYRSGVYAYCSHESFTLKWGVIVHLIQQYCPKPFRILDLGCGRSDILHARLDGSSLGTYVGIDRDLATIEDCRAHLSGEYLTGDLMCFDVSVLGSRRFNCLLWAGIEALPTEYHAALDTFLSVVDVGGILVLDYMVCPPEKAQDRLRGLPGLKHLGGCRLELPYVPPEARLAWPNVNKRIIEAFRKESS